MTKTIHVFYTIAAGLFLNSQNYLLQPLGMTYLNAAIKY